MWARKESQPLHRCMSHLLVASSLFLPLVRGLHSNPLVTRKFIRGQQREGDNDPLIRGHMSHLGRALMLQSVRLTTDEPTIGCGVVNLQINSLAWSRLLSSLKRKRPRTGKRQEGNDCTLC